MGEFQSHKSGYCWKLGEAGDGTSLNTFRGTACPPHPPHIHLRLQPTDSSENQSLWISPLEGFCCRSPGKHAE